jgi:ribose 5-phosphate isomerase B
VRGARCALAHSVETAQLAREHNDANLVSIGARMHDLETSMSLVRAFLDTAFSGDPRHQRRIDQLAAYESGA